MEIRIRETGAVVTEREFRAMHPNSSGPTAALMEQHGADPVFEGPQATGGDRYQFSVRSGVEQGADGHWYTKYVLGPTFTDSEQATAAEQEAAYRARKDAEQAASVRAQRTQLLAATDWTQLDDSPSGRKLAWATYRQALRDVPAQAGFPWAVEWPAQPE